MSSSLFIFTGKIAEVKSVSTTNSDFRSFRMLCATSYNGNHSDVPHGITCFKSFLFQKLDNIQKDAVYLVIGSVGNRKNNKDVWEKSFNAIIVEQVAGDFGKIVASIATAVAATAAASNTATPAIETNKTSAIDMADEIPF